MTLFRRLAGCRRGAASVAVAAAIVPLLMCVSIGMDFSREAHGRAMLQRAVDNAALSGAAAYSLNAQIAQIKAVVEATAAFCDNAAFLPAGFTLTSAGATACSAGNGPIVSTQIAGYRAGTLGIVASSCSATTPIVAGVNCGFVVTVSASVKMSTTFPAFIGSLVTFSATAIAANPFLNIGNAITAQINGSARYSDSIWIYPLLLNSNGDPDFVTNPGAVPGLVSGVYPADASASGCNSLILCGSTGTPAGINCRSQPSACGSQPVSGCTDDPRQFTCGPYTMLASTYYNTVSNPCPASAPCYPNGVGTYPTFIAGVVQNPQAPQAIITATTPLGIAYESTAGGDYAYATGGYQANPSNGCYYPGNTVYTSVSQYYGNTINSIEGPGTEGNPALDWPKVTHWFYSSYLANGNSPTYGEIQSQLQPKSYTNPAGGATVNYNVRVPSVGLDTSGTFMPSLLNCGANNASTNASYDEFITSSFPTTGTTNGALIITVQPANSAYIPPASTGLASVAYTPAATPGAQYSALSCQSFGTNVYTFYWNDMGGNAAYGDDLDYNNGTLRIACYGPSFVVLIG
jgi:hypothetical protein